MSQRVKGMNRISMSKESNDIKAKTVTVPRIRRTIVKKSNLYDPVGWIENMRILVRKHY